MSNWHVLSVDSIHWLWPVLGLMSWWFWRVRKERQLKRNHLVGLVSEEQSRRHSLQQVVRIV